MRDAAAALGASGFDAVFVDAGLGGGWAGDAVERLTGEAPDTPILMITAPSELAAALEAVRRGAQDVR